MLPPPDQEEVGPATTSTSLRASTAVNPSISAPGRELEAMLLGLEALQQPTPHQGGLGVQSAEQRGGFQRHNLHQTLEQDVHSLHPSQVTVASALSQQMQLAGMAGHSSHFAQGNVMWPAVSRGPLLQSSRPSLVGERHLGPALAALLSQQGLRTQSVGVGAASSPAPAPAGSLPGLAGSLPLERRLLLESLEGSGLAAPSQLQELPPLGMPERTAGWPQTSNRLASGGHSSGSWTSHQALAPSPGNVAHQALALPAIRPVGGSHMDRAATLMRLLMQNPREREASAVALPSHPSGLGPPLDSPSAATVAADPTQEHAPAGIPLAARLLMLQSQLHALERSQGLHQGLHRGHSTAGPMHGPPGPGFQFNRVSPEGPAIMQPERMAGGPEDAITRMEPPVLGFRARDSQQDHGVRDPALDPSQSLNPSNEMLSAMHSFTQVGGFLGGASGAPTAGPLMGVLPRVATEEPRYHFGLAGAGDVSLVQPDTGVLSNLAQPPTAAGAASTLFLAQHYPLGQLPPQASDTPYPLLSPRSEAQGLSQFLPGPRGAQTASGGVRSLQQGVDPQRPFQWRKETTANQETVPKPTWDTLDDASLLHVVAVSQGLGHGDITAGPTSGSSDRGGGMSADMTRSNEGVRDFRSDRHAPMHSEEEDRFLLSVIQHRDRYATPSSGQQTDTAALLAQSVRIEKSYPEVTEGGRLQDGDRATSEPLESQATGRSRKKRKIPDATRSQSNRSLSSEEEQRRERKLALNREAARRMRLRNAVRLERLEKRALELQAKNWETQRHCTETASKVEVMKKRVLDLEERLLDLVSALVEDGSALPNMLLKELAELKLCMSSHASERMEGMLEGPRDN